MSTKQTFFRFQWTKQLGFPSWIAALKDGNKMGRCTQCNTIFNLSNMEEQSLRSHVKGKSKIIPFLKG